MLLRRVLNRFLLWSAFACLAVSAWASEYRGQVTFGGLPLPGSTVTVTATQGAKKVVAITDGQGLFYFSDLTDGTWALTIEMTGFAPLKQDIAVAAGGPAGAFEMKLMSLDQIRTEAKPVKVDATQVATAAAPSAPSAATAAAATAAGKPAAAGKGAAAKGGAANAQVAAAGPEQAPAQDATSAQANDGFLINGSVNNAATSQYSMNQAFGNNRNGGHSLYNTNLFLRLDNSALDAKPWSPTGASVSQQFNNYTMGLNFGGPLKIPHVMPRGPYFGLNYARTRNSSVTAQTATLPTGEDSAGNWNLTSANAATIFVPANLLKEAPACNTVLLGMGFTQAEINSGTAIFPSNTIPSGCVSSQSETLLNLYPQPNVSGSPSGFNYQLPLTTSSHIDQVGVNLQKQFGNKNNVNGRFNFSETRTSTPNIYEFLDKQNNLGINTGINWNHRFTQRLSGNLGYSYSRSRSQLSPYFANRYNIQQAAGITGASTNPAFWGPPTLSFTGNSGISALYDGVSAYNRQQTNGVSVGFYWNKFRHNIQFGGDFRRQQFNYLTQSNPYGSLGFTGAVTELVPACPAGTSPCPAAVGGSDFADFLLGIPDTSSIAYGNADKYLRQSAYDLFITDDFRVNPEFSVSFGLRWEYGSPVTETKNRLVNLDVTPGFTAETPVLASNPTGLLTGMHYPTSLVHPDYSRPEPRIGIAWRPISGSSLLVRAGYDVTNDTSVYQSVAYSMAQQSPLSTSLRISNLPQCSFNMASPFVAPTCSTTSPNTFAIDPHFRVGYVQTWNLSVQRDLPYSLQMVVTYLGTKGTRGVQEFLPNTYAPGVTTTPCTSCGYAYRTSNGNLTREAGSVELRRRLRNGFTARLLYTYAKSLDDDYSLSGQGSVSSSAGYAQDWQNLAGQRGLSNTDQRHVFAFTAQYTTGMGIGGKALMSGWKGAVYKEWTIQTSINTASGTPLTPIDGGTTVSGTGVTGSVRPNLVGSPYANVQAGYYLSPAAYAAPSGSWGNARRNSIEGPDQFSMNASMNRTFRLHDKYTLDAQLNATNVLNHVVISGYNTTWTPPVLQSCGTGGGTCSVPSRTFGAPLGAGGMRAISLQFRMRF
jgi:trimeric autotransporter adhesin